MRDIVATGQPDPQGARRHPRVAPRARRLPAGQQHDLGATDGAIRAMDRSGAPVGPDLARRRSRDKRLSITGNVAV